MLIATSTLLSIFLSLGTGRYFNIFILHMILCNEQEDDIIHTVGQNAMVLQSYFFAVSTGTQEDTILSREPTPPWEHIQTKIRKFSLLTFV